MCIRDRYKRKLVEFKNSNKIADGDGKSQGSNTFIIDRICQIAMIKINARIDKYQFINLLYKFSNNYFTSFNLE